MPLFTRSRNAVDKLPVLSYCNSNIPPVKCKLRRFALCDLGNYDVAADGLFTVRAARNVGYRTAQNKMVAELVEQLQR